MEKLKKLGWEVLVIWECEVSKNVPIQEKVVAFLSNAEQT